MSENETTNAQDGQQDTAWFLEAKQILDELIADAIAHGATTDSTDLIYYYVMECCRAELERLLARPTVNIDTARRVAEIYAMHRANGCDEAEDMARKAVMDFLRSLNEQKASGQ